MKQMKYYFYFLALFILSCTKDSPDPNPVDLNPSLYPGCRLDMMAQPVTNSSVVDQVNYKFEYNAEGQIVSAKVLNRTIDRNQLPFESITTFSYINGRIYRLAIGNNDHVEAYDYTGAALLRISVPRTTTPDYTGYFIQMTTDTSRRIIKMVDKPGFVTDIIRDNKGNILEIKKTDPISKRVIYSMIITGYDNKKSKYELLRGIPFDIFQDVEEYMERPLFSVGAGGNPLKAKIYRDNVLKADLEYLYEYSTGGYPTKIVTKDLLKNTVQEEIFDYLGCN